MTEAEERFVKIVRAAIKEMFQRIQGEVTLVAADYHLAAREEITPENVEELKKIAEGGNPLPENTSELIIGELLYYAMAFAMNQRDFNTKDAYKLLAEQLVYAREEIEKELEADSD
tara:strand:+ start:257 stop:604 length:348 start_codon:yes stop_codon:yes gene_type:complete